MATYAIGDIHGCLIELERLLKKIDFDQNKDKLWLVGDLVNRGRDSLETLRFIYNLKDRITLVLGNHDFHLLALQHHKDLITKFPFLAPIFLAPDCDELLSWLSHQSFLHYDHELNFLMVHAGLPPQWDLDLAQSCAKEASEMLHGSQSAQFLTHVYGNKPDLWNDNLVGWNRLRFIVNTFTRMRFCDLNGRLNLTCPAKIGLQPKNYLPWFKIPWRKSKNLKIVFGHWAALEGKADEPLVYALDTGCVWGKALTAMRLEDESFFSINC